MLEKLVVLLIFIIIMTMILVGAYGSYRTSHVPQSIEQTQGASLRYSQPVFQRATFTALP